MTDTTPGQRQLPRFIPSGIVGVLTLPLLLLAAVIAAVVAWPYQWGLQVLSGLGGKAIIVAGLLIPIGGLLLGWLAWIVVEKGHCRSPGTGRLIGWFLGLVALGSSHWVAYRAAAGDYTDVTLSEYLEAATTTGWHVVSRDEPEISGVLVYAFWGLEAVIVLGLAGWLGHKAAREPYCERCGRWAGQETGMVSIRSPGAAGVGAIRQATTVDGLLYVPPPGPDAGGDLGKDQLVYRLKGCARCGATANLTIELVPVVRGVKQNERHLLETLQDSVMLNGQEALAAAAFIARLGPNGDSYRRTSRNLIQAK